MKYKVSINKIIYFSIICFMASIWQGKRQGLLMLIFMIFARYSQREIKIKFRNIFIIAIMMISFFYFFNVVKNIRTNTYDSSEPSYEFLLYAAAPALNMSNIIKYYSTQENYFLPHYVFSELIPNRYNSIKMMESIKDMLFDRNSPSGYLSLWYMDYKFIGAFIGAFLLSVFALFSFSRRNRSEYDMQVYILTLWCCVSSLIYSHFINLNFFILPFFIILILKRSNH